MPRSNLYILSGKKKTEDYSSTTVSFPGTYLAGNYAIPTEKGNEKCAVIIKKLKLYSRILIVLFHVSEFLVSTKSGSTLLCYKAHVESQD